MTRSTSGSRRRHASNQGFVVDLEHATPASGHLTIGEASTKRIQAFIDTVARDHGSGSAKGCRSVLSGMFALAIRNDAVRINPVIGVAGIEKTRSRTSAALPLDELSTFVERVRNDEQLRRLDVADLVEFMAGTGCRIGEALALRVKNVSLARKTVTLGPSVTRIPRVGLTIREAGKTETSNRTIVVPDATIALLMRRVALIDSQDDVVFPSLLGKLCDPANTETAWRSNRTRLGYPGFKLHGLRKTVATALDAAGLSARDIAEYLGHKRPSMTQDVYMSRTTQSAKAAAALDSKFGVSSGLEA